jgi:hypothetical protein
VVEAICQSVKYPDLKRGSMSDEEWKQINLHYADILADAKDYHNALKAYGTGNRDYAKKYVDDLVKQIETAHKDVMEVYSDRTLDGHYNSKWGLDYYKECMNSVVDWPAEAICLWSKNIKPENDEVGLYMSSLINKSRDNEFVIELPTKIYKRIGYFLENSKRLVVSGGPALVNVGVQQKGELIFGPDCSVEGYIGRNAGTIDVRNEKTSVCEILDNAGTISLVDLSDSLIQGNKGKIYARRVINSNVYFNEGKIFASEEAFSRRPLIKSFPELREESYKTKAAGIYYSKLVNNDGLIVADNFFKSKNETPRYHEKSILVVGNRAVDCKHMRSLRTYIEVDDIFIGGSLLGVFLSTLSLIHGENNGWLWSTAGVGGTIPSIFFTWLGIDSRIGDIKKLRAGCEKCAKKVEI